MRMAVITVLFVVSVIKNLFKILKTIGFYIFLFYVIGYIQKINGIVPTNTGKPFYDFVILFPTAVYTQVESFLQPLYEGINTVINSIIKENITWN